MVYKKNKCNTVLELLSQGFQTHSQIVSKELCPKSVLLSKITLLYHKIPV